MGGRGALVCLVLRCWCARPLSGSAGCMCACQRGRDTGKQDTHSSFPFLVVCVCLYEEGSSHLQREEPLSSCGCSCVEGLGVGCMKRCVDFWLMVGVHFLEKGVRESATHHSAPRMEAHWNHLFRVYVCLCLCLVVVFSAQESQRERAPSERGCWGWVGWRATQPTIDPIPLHVIPSLSLSPLM